MDADVMGFKGVVRLNRGKPERRESGLRYKNKELDLVPYAPVSISTTLPMMKKDLGKAVQTEAEQLAEREGVERGLVGGIKIFYDADIQLISNVKGGAVYVVAIQLYF